MYTTTTTQQDVKIHFLFRTVTALRLKVEKRLQKSVFFVFLHSK